MPTLLIVALPTPGLRQQRGFLERLPWLKLHVPGA
jgi:hypothetical protein